MGFAQYPQPYTVHKTSDFAHSQRHFRGGRNFRHIGRATDWWHKNADRYPSAWRLRLDTSFKHIGRLCHLRGRARVCRRLYHYGVTNEFSRTSEEHHHAGQYPASRARGRGTPGESRFNAREAILSLASLL